MVCTSDLLPAKTPEVTVFDFRPHCTPCLWCCHGERVFVSPKEQRALGEDRFGNSPAREEAPCEKLNTATGLCSIHERRPIECRIFPLDLLVVKEQVHWVVWHGACPAVPSVPPEYLTNEMNRWDQELEPEWVQAYINHHLVNQPAKYRPGMFTVLRPYRAAKDSAQ